MSTTQLGHRRTDNEDDNLAVKCYIFQTRGSLGIGHAQSSQTSHDIVSSTSTTLHERVVQIQAHNTHTRFQIGRTHSIFLRILEHSFGLLFFLVMLESIFFKYSPLHSEHMSNALG